MRDGDLTYDDFLQRLNIQDVLIDAGYHLNRRDGLRYPSYVRLDSDGRRIRGVWGIERSGFFNGREKWAKGFENQRV